MRYPAVPWCPAARSPGASHAPGNPPRPPPRPAPLGVLAVDRHPPAGRMHLPDHLGQHLRRHRWPIAPLGTLADRPSAMTLHQPPDASASSTATPATPPTPPAAPSQERTGPRPPATARPIDPRELLVLAEPPRQAGRRSGTRSSVTPVSRYWLPCWRSSASSSGSPGCSAPGWVCTSTRPGSGRRHQPPSRRRQGRKGDPVADDVQVAFLAVGQDDAAEVKGHPAPPERAPSTPALLAQVISPWQVSPTPASRSWRRAWARSSTQRIVAP